MKPQNTIPPHHLSKSLRATSEKAVRCNQSADNKVIIWGKPGENNVRVNGVDFSFPTFDEAVKFACDERAAKAIIGTALPNYRIYDRTGGGVTEDIYAETLEDAIEAGREWIEDGDWSDAKDGITLECEVGEIIRAKGLLRVEFLDAAGSVIGTHDSGDQWTKLDEQVMDEWIEDPATDRLDGEPEFYDSYRYASYGECHEVDEEQTRDSERHDYSGTYHTA